eukprot:979382-Pleurochrysis_carterae.AAC.1
MQPTPRSPSNPHHVRNSAACARVRACACVRVARARTGVVVGAPKGVVAGFCATGFAAAPPNVVVGAAPNT